MSSRSTEFSHGFTRRDAFKILGATGAAVALSGRIARADTPAPTTTALPQGAGFYRTHVGEFEITVVSDGGFPFTPYPTIGSNASQGEVEKVLKDNFIDPAKLMGQVNVLAVRRGSGPVTLIDTGSGKLFGPAAGFAKQNLINSGVKPEDVANVVFTHLHPDHVGGALGDDGKPTFANAKHWVNKTERDFWAGPNPDLSKSGVPEAMRPTMIGAAKNAIDKLGDRLQAFEVADMINNHEPILDGPGYEIAAGVTAIQTGGHTPGHCVLMFESNGESLVYVTDLVVQAALCFAHPEWLVGFDTDMKATVEIRKKVYDRLAAGGGTLISGSHLPFPALGHVKKAETGYQFMPSLWNWA